MFGRHMTLLALKKPGAQNYFSLVRPNTGESYFDMEVRDMTTMQGWTCKVPTPMSMLFNVGRQVCWHAEK